MLLEGLSIDELLFVVAAATQRLRDQLQGRSDNTQASVALAGFVEGETGSMESGGRALVKGGASNFPVHQVRRALRISEVTRRTGLSRTTIWRQVQAEEFPRPRRLGKNAIGWDEEDVYRWLASRPLARP